MKHDTLTPIEQALVKVLVSAVLRELDSNTNARVLGGRFVGDGNDERRDGDKHTSRHTTTRHQR